MNKIKQKLINNQLTIGSWITLGHISIAEIMASAGFDWLVIDMEHSVIDYYEAEQLIAIISLMNVVPLIRVGENNDLIIKRAMDAGASGVIVPMINTKKDAEQAVSAVKYPPHGSRGVGLARAQGYGFTFEEYAERVNEESIVIAQIEHIDALNNLEKILEVDGIDGCIIGPYDLSGSMGKPGKYENSEVLEVLSRIEKICNKKEKALGFHVIQPDYRLVAEKIEKGYTFIAFSLDILFLGTICRQQIKMLKENNKL